ncbi:MAG TPA: hypothetical protein VIG74_00790, partial [Alphaproteobacteria bacterium]
MFGKIFSAAANPAFDPQRDYAPSAVQLAFIRLAAQKNWYMAFGDTNHASPEIHAFVLNEKTVEALLNSGKKRYFLEGDPGDQKFYDALRTSGGKHTVKRPKHYLGTWIKKRAAEKRLFELFEQTAIKHPAMHFTPVDQRLDINNVELYNKTERALKDLSEVGVDPTVTMAFHVASFISGLFSGGFHKAVSNIKDSFQSVAEYIKDDRKSARNDLIDDRLTAQCIEQFSEPSTILYGDAHFTSGQFGSLRMLLPTPDRNLCVLSIYNNRQDYEGRLKRNQKAG